jgi:hypothetical protein
MTLSLYKEVQVACHAKANTRDPRAGGKESVLLRSGPKEDGEASDLKASS